MAKTCDVCQLVNPDSADRCDCGALLLPKAPPLGDRELLALVAPKYLAESPEPVQGVRAAVQAPRPRRPGIVLPVTLMVIGGALHAFSIQELSVGVLVFVAGALVWVVRAFRRR